MTINKAQSQSLDRVSVLLDLPIFIYSQLYIVLLQITRFDGIFLAIPGASLGGKLQNVVFKKNFRVILQG